MDDPISPAVALLFTNQKCTHPILRMKQSPHKCIHKDGCKPGPSEFVEHSWVQNSRWHPLLWLPLVASQHSWGVDSGHRNLMVYWYFQADSLQHMEARGDCSKICSTVDSRTFQIYTGLLQIGTVKAVLHIYKSGFQKDWDSSHAGFSKAISGVFQRFPVRGWQTKETQKGSRKTKVLFSLDGICHAEDW